MVHRLAVNAFYGPKAPLIFITVEEQQIDLEVEQVRHLPEHSRFELFADVVERSIAR